MTLLAIGGHLVLNILLGWSLLSLKPGKRSGGENLVLALMLGIYIETLFAAVLMFIGFKLTLSILFTVLLTILLFLFVWKQGKLSFPAFTVIRPRWYEWLLMLTVAEKLIFVAWQVLRTHLHFDDAMNHWGARAYSLYGGVNWSFDPDSPLFLGAHIAFNHYPLGTLVWSATTAVFNGGWNDVIARVEGLIFFSVVIATVWLAVWRFSKTRWLASFAAFAVSALPLQVWHAASGYSEMAVETYAVVALAALLRKEWFLAGVMVAGAAWSKNDGLALFVPAILMGVGLWQFSWSDLIKLRWFDREKWQNIGWSLLGVATLAPWSIYKQVQSLILSQHGTGFDWHPDSPKLFWDYVVMGPTHSIFWLVLLATMILSSFVLCRDQAGRALFGVFWTLFFLILYVFFFTSAYEWLRIQTTIHRTMLQFAGIAVVSCTYGIWLFIRPKVDHDS
ncbi:MAG: hypothetical protein HQM13_23490 [SAR324 cluster bacterium]|nr:hypothetical protein [SAR324 cluster bacterium]